MTVSHRHPESAALGPEWRLLSSALRAVVAAGEQVVLSSPPKTPHLPGLRPARIDAHHVVWIQARAPAERLWCTEKLIKSNNAGVVLVWLPQARPEQIRRLHARALACDGPVFLLRPGPAQHDASAAPLRVLATIGLDGGYSFESSSAGVPPATASFDGHRFPAVWPRY